MDQENKQISFQTLNLITRFDFRILNYPKKFGNNCITEVTHYLLEDYLGKVISKLV